jgi:aminopeptidase-like protein
VDFEELKKLSHQPGIEDEMLCLMEKLYPICRSITGDGVRETLRILQEYIPIQVSEVPSGTTVFDWNVPPEWNIRDGYIADQRGVRIVDFRKCNLHVMGYSEPIRAKMMLSDLCEHLFTIPEQPDWIPYRTSYYKKNWGFCLTQRQRALLREDEEYEVCIDATLADGHLTFGECLIPGEGSDEVLISCHICHPSLCNDNLSGIVVATALAKQLQSIRLRYSYRILFIPGTIGSITWLWLNQSCVNRIKHGLVVTGVGDAGCITYKKSRQDDAEIDEAMSHVLSHSASAYKIIDFFPYGYDERQYCSPGFNLPVGCFMRTPHGQYAEYHTSADNLEFVQPASLSESFRTILTGLCVLEKNRCYVNRMPFCEPQLGKRGLYRTVAGQREGALKEMALLWTLNLSDGHHSLLQIAKRANLSIETVAAAAESLVAAGLLTPSS